jgi:uncharacterized radical SAM superfamily Fe-S cluster-containing enzyme
VPTIAGGINEDQVGKILKFALDNIDVSSGISYQPVAITGRINYEERLKLRFTLPDLVRCIEEQTGIASKDDWYPLSFVQPVSKIISSVRGSDTVHITCHPSLFARHLSIHRAEHRESDADHALHRHRRDV